MEATEVFKVIMVKIRLMRVGAKKNPHYRVVVVDSRKKRSSDYIELLGHYDPRDTTETPLNIDADRAAYWLDQGSPSARLPMSNASEPMHRCRSNSSALSPIILSPNRIS
jgi:small subunit ribosomal protein S16